MLSRRSILRALGFGAPAAAVVVAIEGAYAKELRAAADKATAGYADAVVTASPVNVGGLSAINAKLGDVTAGRVLNADHSLIIDLRAGTFTAHS